MSALFAMLPSSSLDNEATAADAVHLMFSFFSKIISGSQNPSEGVIRVHHLDLVLWGRVLSIKCCESALWDDEQREQREQKEQNGDDERGQIQKMVVKLFGDLNMTVKENIFLGTTIYSRQQDRCEYKLLHRIMRDS